MTELAQPRGNRQTGGTAHRPLPRRVVMTGNIVAQVPPPRPALTSDLAAPIGRPVRTRPAALRLVTGSVAVLVLVALACVALVGRGRSWARWALLVTTLPLLLALDVTQSVVTGGADLDRIALLAAAGLFVLGLVPLLTRSARAWFRPARG